MDPVTEIYLKLAVSFLLSGLIFVVMMRIQKAKEKAAEYQFRLTLLSKGLDLTIKEDKWNT